MGILNNRLQK